jgi:hypothetical protein
MKRILIAFLTLAILASCSPQRRLARLLERHPLPVQTDTVYLPGETIYLDTTIVRYLPGETNTVEVPVHVVASAKDTTIIAETTLATALMYRKNNKVTLQVIQKDTVLRFMLDSAIRMHSDTLIITKEQVVTKEVDVTKPFWKIGFLILGGLIVIGMILRFALGK